MKEIQLTSNIIECKPEELPQDDQRLVQLAIDATQRSYAPYSHFHVGAAIRLTNGIEIIGCNQENAAFPAGICAERSAIFAAGAQYPDQPVEVLAIAAADDFGNLQDEPVSPCGTCRQVLIETETRFKHPIRILLYGRRCVYVIHGIAQLMPLSFKDF